jgi:hypothetical protein
MSDYNGPSRNCRVKIIAVTGPWGLYNGQDCDAIIYRPDMLVHINSEQLNPSLPKWQSISPEQITEIRLS